MAHAFPCFTPNPVELCSGRPNCGATQSFGEKLTLAQVSARISFQQPLDPYFRLCAFLAIKAVSRARLRKTRKELIQWFCIYWRAEGRLQGLSEQFLGQRQRRLEIPKTDKLKRLRTFLLRILTRPEQRIAFERQANRYLADLQGSRSSSSTTSVDE